MLDIIVWMGLAFLACTGLVQIVSWIAVHTSRKGNSMFRIVPVGGRGKDTDSQMALMYTCARWEANPAGQVYVLYGPGLDEQRQKECEDLARDTGALFARTPEDLQYLLLNGM